MPESQGGSQQAGGSSGQAATDVGGDVKQMSIGDLLDLANQQNVDVSPVTELLNNLNLSPEVGISGTGNVGGDEDESA